MNNWNKNMNNQIIKISKSILFIFFYIFFISNAFAYPYTRCEHSALLGTDTEYYKLIKNWVDSEWSNMSISRVGIIRPIAQVLYHSSRRCATLEKATCYNNKTGSYEDCMVDSKTDQATQTLLQYFEHQLDELDNHFYEGETYFDTKNCTVYEKDIDFGPLGLTEYGRTGYRFKCGNSIYLAFVNCVNGSGGWIKWERDLCTPKNGSCVTPYELNKYDNSLIDYGYDGGTGLPYSTGASCNGTNPYCGYYCEPPTCPPNLNTAHNYPNPLTSKNEQPCGSSSKDILGIEQKYAGTLNCQFTTSTPDSQSTKCKVGNLPHCYSFKTCREINQNYPHEFQNIDSFNQNEQELKSAFSSGTASFDPDLAINAGVKGLRCGKYEITASSWLQTVGGNIYAQGNIYASKSNSFDSTCTSNNQCSPYIIRVAGDCSAAPSNSAGIAISNIGGSSNFFKPSKIQNRPSYNQVIANPAFDSSIIKNQFDYQALRSLQGDLTNCTNGQLPTKICKHTGDFTLSLNQDLTVDGEKVLFIDGNLFIKGEGRLIVPNGNYLAFIVSGTITIDPSVGTSITRNTATCAQKGDGHIQGVFIANEIKIPSNKIEVSPIFNPGVYCDKKLILEGSYISWSEDIAFQRDFKGCGLGVGSYPNYNATNPTETIIYRPDFITNTPDWMKQPKMMRLEAI